ncbi:neutral/alkaline non-lysosomal ceramidase N-terminal domain-containing protein [Caproiciproducens sp. R1]|uniref:neutral/alkaline non-lysosomal ceramidase N-terminal domain-containing protein n=1 Tax=Caproiciproducens sp. R1 TaxID=3435000 RepID=UPI0040336C54
MSIIKAGYGKAYITPPLRKELAGFAGEGRIALGVHDELYARVLLLQNNNETYCIVQTDLLDIDDGFAADIRRDLAGLGLKDSNVFAGAIHTHSGPKGTNKGIDPFIKGMENLMGGYDKELCNRYIRSIHKAVENAFKNLCPCNFRYGMIRTEGIATNRNDKRLPGDPVLLALEGTRADGKKLLVYNVACHPTTMNFQNRMISADLPGGVAGFLEDKVYAMVMFLNGSCGDISTRFTRTASTFDEVERISGKLCKYIDKALKQASPLPADPLKTGAFTYPMAVKKLDSVENAKAKLEKLSRELQRAHSQSRKDLRLFESRVEGAQSNLSLSVGFGGVDMLPMEVRFFRMGTLVFVFVPGELFSALSNPLRAAYGNEVVFCGYFGGYQGYIPDTSSYLAETYETLSSPYERGEGEKLMEAVRDMILSLK